MKQVRFAWHEGKRGALTTSWDDGTIHDRRVVETFNRHGIRGTFNLNSACLGDKAAQTGWYDRIGPDEVKSLYAGHEVACHGVTHPWLQQLADDQIRMEFIEDRRALERLVGYPVRGLALPFGTWDDRVLRIAVECGILYSRPVTATSLFSLPNNFMDWQTTCHHKANLPELWQKFQKTPHPDKLFYLWGHSYEFDKDKNWNVIEAFAELAGADRNTWHATNMQVYDYVTAWRSLQFSVDLDVIRNRSALPLWFKAGNDLCRIGPGEVVAVK
ncbi:MAG: polysaccharide deacetylase [Verrucomicrobia bacterium]|nr:polysaccharide deacetylase [Verrucomicrobiota bacterium]